MNYFTHKSQQILESSQILHLQTMTREVDMTVIEKIAAEIKHSKHHKNITKNPAGP